MNSFEKKMYEGLLPEVPANGKRGYYPVCSAKEWDELPLPYKVMEWSPVKDYRDKGQLKAVKAVIFDVTYMEPYKISAKVSVHPSEVQKILFCLHKDPQCLLYSVCGIELEGGTQLGAKWLQDSISGAFGICAGGQYVGQQGGFRGLIPEKVQRKEDGSFEYEWHKQGATKSSHYELSNPFDHQRPEKDATEKLIDSMIEFGSERGWGDNKTIEALVSCGVKREDFVRYGHGDSVKDYFEKENSMSESRQEMLFAVNKVLDFLEKEQADCDKWNTEEMIGMSFAYEKAIQAVEECFADVLGEREKAGFEKGSLDDQIKEAESSGKKLGEIIKNAMKTATREGYEQFVYRDREGDYCFCRSAYGKPVVPMFEGEKIIGKVTFNPNQRDVEFVPVGKDEGVKQKGLQGEKQVKQDFGERE